MILNLFVPCKLFDLKVMKHMGRCEESCEEKCDEYLKRKLLVGELPKPWKEHETIRFDISGTFACTQDYSTYLHNKSFMEV